MTETLAGADTAPAVLDFARCRRAVADAAEVDLVQAAVQWAAMHAVDSIDDAATYASRGFGDTGIAVAGPGAPLVAEFAVTEFAAALGLPTEAGKRYVGEALELRYRLPRHWARVVAGDLQVWRARRVAATTIGLTPEAAAYVDRHVAGVAHKIRPAQLDRLVAEAIARYMPDQAEKDRQRAADGRHFTIDHTQISFCGTSQVWGELDLADAQDLDTAITQVAATLKDLGCDETLDVRRSLAAGQLARRQLTLDLNTNEADPADPADPADHDQTEAAPSPAAERRRGRKPRQVVLYVHLSDTALHPTRTGAGCGLEVGRVENTRSMVTADQVRDWCHNPDAQVVVKPVIDLADHIGVDQYEIPDRLAERVALRDHACVFPWCSRPARTLEPDRHDADCDHITPYNKGGPTCSCNLAALCRRHHRVKTHGGWTYTTLEPGTYLWTSPYGYQYLRDHHGTIDVSRDRRRPTGRPPDQ